MRYQSVLVVDYDCNSDDEALAIAFQQHRELRDMLLIEGPDEAANVRLERLVADGIRDVLQHAHDKNTDP